MQRLRNGESELAICNEGERITVVKIAQFKNGGM